MLLTHVLIGAREAFAKRLFAVRPAKDRVEAVLREVLPAGLAKLATAEAMVLIYCIAWWVPADVPKEARPFSYHRDIQYIFAIMIGLTIVELVITHIVLRATGHSRIDSIALIFGEVGILYFVGLLNSLRKLPILVTRDGVLIRTGLLIRHFIPKSDIAAVYSVVGYQDMRQKHILRASLIGYPTIMITLQRPTNVNHLLRGSREVTTIALRADDSDTLRAALMA